jgi:hypothetical protein
MAAARSASGGACCGGGESSSMSGLARWGGNFHLAVASRGDGGPAEQRERRAGRDKPPQPSRSIGNGLVSQRRK